MLKIAITGATGLVGSRVIELLKDDFTFIPLPSKELDITNKEQVSEVLYSLDYDMLLHLAAYTNVDGAETEKETAYAINVKGTQHLFETTREQHKKFIYISTGFVFDGQHPPYDEDSIPHPIGYYGQTKYDGELVVKDKAMIIRFEYPYGPSPAPKKDFARVMKSLMEQGRTIKGITNSLMTPTLIDDIAEGFKYLLNNYSPETFHFVGADSLSPFDVAKTIAKTFNLDESLVQPTTYEEYFAGKAQRPLLAQVISKKNNFHKMKTFEEGLQYMKSIIG